MVDFSINVADAAIGLRRASKKNDADNKTPCFSAVELEKNVTRTLCDFCLNTRTYEYCSPMEEQ